MYLQGVLDALLGLPDAGQGLKLYVELCRDVVDANGVPDLAMRGIIWHALRPHRQRSAVGALSDDVPCASRTQ